MMVWSDDPREQLRQLDMLNRLYWFFHGSDAERRAAVMLDDDAAARAREEKERSALGLWRLW